MMKRWLDIDPSDWYYRAVIEADHIFLDPLREETLFHSKIYNAFENGKERQVYNFTTYEGQTKFHIPGYVPHPKEYVLIYLDGVPVNPSKLEPDYVHVGQPLSGGISASVFLSGVPKMLRGDPLINDAANCLITPFTRSCKMQYPMARLEKANDYVFDTRYALNESCVCLGMKLRRVEVTPQIGETIQDALMRVIGFKKNVFTIYNGNLYVSFNLNGFPCMVSYNYRKDNVIKNRQNEVVVPISTCAGYQDRFFPEITITRAEFFVLLNRMRKNLYNRYTDTGYIEKPEGKTERYIKDIDQILGRWFAVDVLNILDEKFLDGCYVFPLYDDDTFEPRTCVTRAEAACYVHRFIDWALERFR